MDRRSFLLTAGAAAGLAPALGVGPALAAPRLGGAAAVLPGSRADQRLRRQVARLRRRQDRVAARSLARVGLAGVEIDPEERAWARSAGAMAAIDGLARIPVADQLHPAVQALTGQLFEQVALGLQALRRRFEQVAASPREPSPDELDAAFARQLQALGEETELSEASRRLHHNGLDALRAELAEEGLRARTAREARRLSRLEAMAERIALAGGSTAVLTPADPRVQGEVARGRGRWAALSSDSLPADAPGDRPGPTAAQVLGLIGCGLGIVVGGFLVVVGIACGISCDAPGVLLVALLGALVIGACVWGILSIKEAVRRRRTTLEPAGDPEALLP